MQGVPNDSPRGGIAVAQFAGGQGGGSGSPRRSTYARFAHDINNPLAIILSLTFWGLVWGIAGLFLAVPITGAFAIVCRHIDNLHWVAVALAGPEPHARRRQAPRR